MQLVSRTGKLYCLSDLGTRQTALQWPCTGPCTAFCQHASSAWLRHDSPCKCANAGHTVIAAHRSDTADRAMPPWSPVTATVDVVCRLHQRINDVYDVSQIDVVVVGIFHQVTHPTCAPAALLQACCKSSKRAAGAHLTGNAMNLYHSLHNNQMRCEKNMFRMLSSCATKICNSLIAERHQERPSCHTGG